MYVRIVVSPCTFCFDMQVHRVRGYLPLKVVHFIMNLRTTSHAFYLSRWVCRCFCRRLIYPAIEQDFPCCLVMLLQHILSSLSSAVYTSTSTALIEGISASTLIFSDMKVPVALNNLNNTVLSLYFSLPFYYRHGQSEYNAIGRIGGDSGLSTHGVNYARKLADFVEEHVSPTLLSWKLENRRNRWQ